MENIVVNYEVLNENAVKPDYANYSYLKGSPIPGDACMDVVATSVEYNKEKKFYVYGTGLKFELPQMTMMSIRPRSSIRNKNAVLCNTPGTVDWTYNKEVFICFRNLTTIEQMFKEREHDIVVNMILEKKGLSEIRKELIKFRTSTKDIDPIKFAPYQVGDKIAQIIITEYKPVIMNKVDFILDSGRGGFGSTDGQENAIK